MQHFTNKNSSLQETCCIIKYIWFLFVSVVTQAGLKGRDKQVHPTLFVGCNNLSLPFMPTCACIFSLFVNIINNINRFHD